MATGDYSFRRVLIGEGSVEDSAVALCEILGDSGSIVAPTERAERPGGLTLAFRMGSRIRYRLLGVLAGSALPIRLHFHLTGSDEVTEVLVSLRSDQGWYVAHTGVSERRYGLRFLEILESLRRRGFRDSVDELGDLGPGPLG